MEQPPEPRHKRETTDQDDERLERLNHALEAYKRLPDIDPANPDLLSAFDQHYTASYPTMSDLVRDMCELDELEAAVDQFAAEHGIEGCLRLDTYPLQRLVLDAWDIVAHGPWLHVFEPGPTNQSDEPDSPEQAGPGEGNR